MEDAGFSGGATADGGRFTVRTGRVARWRNSFTDKGRNDGGTGS